MQALLLIFFSEIGDKTFFIALLLALQQPRSLVFAGARGGGRACFAGWRRGASGLQFAWDTWRVAAEQ